MIHLLRWLAIFATAWFIWWAVQPYYPRYRARDKKNRREVS